MAERELEQLRVGEPGIGRIAVLTGDRARWQGLGMVLAIFLLSRLAFYAAAFFGSWLLPEASDLATLTVNSRLALAMHWRGDAIHYYTLVVDGYLPHGLTGFFPLFPLLIHSVATVLAGFRRPTPLPIGEAELAPLIAGVLVANAAALLAFTLLFALAREETGDEPAAQRTLLYTALFPLAFYYAVAYSESLYLATSVGAFLAARRRQWVRAGLWAGAASATRPYGLILAPVLALEMFISWRRGELRGPELPRALLGLLLTPLGLLLFMLHLWWRTGDPLAFIHAQQQGWKHEWVFPLTSLARGVGYALNPSWSSSPDMYARGALHTLIVVGFLVVFLASVRWWRPSYVLYAALLFGLLLASPMPEELTMHSLGRYVMILFPVYFTLARWGRHPLVHHLILALWLPLFGLLTALFVRWYPIF